MCDNNLVITDNADYTGYVGSAITKYRIIASFAYPDLPPCDIDFIITGIITDAANDLKRLLDRVRELGGSDYDYIDGISVLSDTQFKLLTEMLESHAN